MKRYVMLSTFTFLAIAAVLILGTVSRNSIVQVNIVKVSPLTVENSVICSGRVERISTRSVYAPSAAVVSHVYVKVGDKVSAGQSLMEIEVPSENPDTSNLTGTYETMLNQYSQQSQQAVTAQTITAPYAGEISSLSATDQGYVQPGIPVAEISESLDQLQVRLSVNESQIAEIKTGQKAVITGVGFKNTSYTGIVKSISSDAKQITSTTGQETIVEVIVKVNSPGTDIKPGYTAKAKIVISEDSGVLVAPYEAVRADKDGSEYVFKLNEKRAVKTPVVTNKEFDNGFEVTSGLSKNDEIIANPDTVSDGTYVIPTQKGALRSDG